MNTIKKSNKKYIYMYIVKKNKTESFSIQETQITLFRRSLAMKRKEKMSGKLYFISKIEQSELGA